MRGGRSIAKKMTNLGFKVEFWEEEGLDRSEVEKKIREYKEKYEEKFKEKKKNAYLAVIKKCQELLTELFGGEYWQA